MLERVDGCQPSGRPVGLDGEMNADKPELGDGVVSSLLKGYRVLESAQLINGDHLSACLGDLGADVIKIESPDRGDYLREILGQMAPHCSPAHLQMNKNKRSVTINLKARAGREIFFDLVRTADVFVDGNLAGVADRLGIGYEQQREVNPSIVYCQHTGFGASGPYSGIPAHGEMMESAAAGRPVRMADDGFVVAGPPIQPEIFASDLGGHGPIAGGIYGAFHVAAALAHREQTGLGCHIDISASEAVVAHAVMRYTYALHQDRLNSRSALPARDRGRLLGAKYQYYQTADERYLLFCCIEPKFWRRFCALIDRPDLSGQHDPAAEVDFGDGNHALRHELQTVIGSRTLAEWLELAASEQLPIGPAYSSPFDVTEDAQFRAREIFQRGSHPAVGEFTYVGQPVVVRDDPYEVRLPAPDLGQHTEEVLKSLGLADSRIKELRCDGVI